MLGGLEGAFATAAGLARAALPGPSPGPVASESRWDRARSEVWRREVGWLVGCNFVPSTAGNQLEMWQRATYDPETIDRELGWAASLGFNSVRVFLHDVVWDAEGDGFLDRLDGFLAIADAHGITTMPVFFDGVWNPRPRPGPQPEPRPGVHNSTWVQSPGSAVLADRRRWGALRAYVEDVVGRFAHDRRIAAWDLFNEPDNPNVLSYVARETAHKARRVRDLLELSFDAAAGVDPDQPLTSGVFLGVGGSTEKVSRLNRTMLARSDVVSFHCYGSLTTLEAAIDHLARYGKPLLCTEWLARPRSPVGLLAVLAERGVGAYSWGLVDGRSQTRFPWTSWLRRGRDREGVWFHDLLHSDGTPYSVVEVETIRRVTALHGARV